MTSLDSRPARQIDSRWPVAAAALSILLHGAALLWVGSVPGPTVTAPERPTLEFQLIAGSVPEPGEAAEEIHLQEQQRAEPIAQASPAAEKEPDPDPPVPAEPSKRAEPVDSEPGFSVRLRAQLGNLEPENRPGTEIGTLRNRAPTASGLPALPGAPSLFSTRLDRVTPQSHHWESSDGSRNARYVLADGTVLCTRRRPPTAAEIVNPWKSLQVTMVRLCGRSSPEATDVDPLMQRTLPRPAGFTGQPRSRPRGAGD